jgi:hypothetical protein
VSYSVQLDDGGAASELAPTATCVLLTEDVRTVIEQAVVTYYDHATQAADGVFTFHTLLPGIGLVPSGSVSLPLTTLASAGPGVSVLVDVGEGLYKPGFVTRPSS